MDFFLVRYGDVASTRGMMGGDGGGVNRFSKLLFLQEHMSVIKPKTQTSVAAVKWEESHLPIASGYLYLR